MKKILYVYVKGGAPLEHVFPRIAGCGELHVLALMPLPATAEADWRPACTSITELTTDARGEALVELVTAHARELGADAVLSMSEFAGLMVTKQIEEVFGMDPIAMLVRELLGEPVDYPAAMLVEGKRAAASLAVIPTDAQGTPWSGTPRWRPGAVDWSALLSPGTTAEPVKAFAMPEGEPVPVYDPSGGSRNWLGVFLVTAEDAETLRRDCNAVLNGLEAALSASDRSGLPAAN
ncbi:YbjQ family protein [Crossiella sp. SN42]|uniref:YbjQ family protein n=1 Tax=Crossiella sp. SN42 TaxID=2944808 RepID=UPI00207D6019|nr:YbjQ family protein [Crossiella sp. SN42]MCO1574491.1 YbjQ family protein [Crossiella sp. SN42]